MNDFLSNVKADSALYSGVENLPPALWSDLAEMEPDSVCRRAAVTYRLDKGFLLPFLGGEYLVNPKNRGITGLGKAYPIGFQAGLVMLSYLLCASEADLTGRMITAREIKGGSFFFQGPHALSKQNVLKRYARDGAGFLTRALSWGASPLALGDAAFRILVLPKVLVAYTFYEEDDEFPARLVITFDASIEKHLPLDAIFAMVNVISHQLVR